MSQIVSEVYDAFRAANVDEALAKAAAGAIAGRDDLVTRLDLERAVTRMQAEFARVETSLNTKIADLKGDLNAKIGRVETRPERQDRPGRDRSER